MKRLTKKQFDKALRNGLGRALMHVKEHGIGTFVEPLERACLKNYSYDDLDSGRSAWLYKIISAGKMQKHFAHFLKENIRRYASREDLVQMAFLAEYLYFDGEKSCKIYLKNHTFNSKIPGLSALEQVIDEEKKSKTKKSRKTIKRNPNDVIKSILEDKIFPGFSSLAKRFTVEERLEVLNNLPKANKLKHLWHFFEFFEQVELPELKESFFKHAMIKQLGPRARIAIFKALSNTKDERIWKFAYDSIEKDPDCIHLGAIELFKKNYKKGDCDFILESIRKVRSPQKKHNAFIDLRNVLENNKKKELLPCIIWMWENSPCATCRGSLIDIFRNTVILPKWLLEEGLYDSDDDTREWCNEILKRY